MTKNIDEVKEIANDILMTLKQKYSHVELVREVGPTIIEIDMNHFKVVAVIRSTDY